MWGRYIDEDYIIVAPESYAGVEDFNKKPEMMIQFDFKEVKDAEGFDESLPINYKNYKNYIRRYNTENPYPEKTQEEKVLALIDLYLSTFQGTRSDTSIDDESSDGAYIPLNKEEEILNEYRSYLENIKNDKDFPYVEVLNLQDWLKTR